MGSGDPRDPVRSSVLKRSRPRLVATSDAGVHRLLVGPADSPIVVPLDAEVASSLHRLCAGELSGADGSEYSEIERRFLCRPCPPRELPPGVRIRQAYLSPGEPTFRVRQTEQTFTVAFKAGSGLTRTEVEFGVPRDAAAALFDFSAGALIEKCRHADGPWELDRFLAQLEGLWILEIELDAEDEALPPLPAYVDVVREIPPASGLSNSSLSRMSDAAARELVARLYGEG